MGLTLVKSKTGDYDYFQFTSENGITYDLLEGVTLGGRKSATSGMIFIVLNTFCDDNISDNKLIELTRLMGGCSMMVINFFCSAIISEGNDAREEDEKVINHYVNQFETKNKELIDFIKQNNVPTSCCEVE